MRISTATRQASGTHRPEPTSEHWIFSTTRCSTDEHFASSRSLISEVARVCLEANFRLSGRCVGQALDRLAAQRGWPNVITVDNGTEFTSKALVEWAYRRGVKLDYTRPGKLP